MSYNAVSSNPNVVSANLIPGVPLLDIIPAGIGTATVTLTADDGKGGTTDMTINVTVN